VPLIAATESRFGSRQKRRETRACYTSRFPDERKITSRQEIGYEKSPTCRWWRMPRLPTRYGRLPLGFKGARAAGRSGRAGPRNLNRKDRSLVRVHSQCLTGDFSPRFAATAAPRLELSLKKNRAGIVGNSALSTAGRPRHRADEQTAGVRTAGRRDGHGGSK